MWLRTSIAPPKAVALWSSRGKIRDMIVRDLMSAPVFSIREDKRLLAAQEIMNWAHIRHVPVVDTQGVLTGILSHRDLLGAAVSSLAVRIAEAERRQDLAAKQVKNVVHLSDEAIHQSASKRG